MSPIKWIKKEIVRSEKRLLEAEDELANAKLTVTAHRARLVRLKAHAKAYDSAVIGYEAGHTNVAQMWGPNTAPKRVFAPSPWQWLKRKLA